MPPKRNILANKQVFDWWIILGWCQYNFIFINSESDKRIVKKNILLALHACRKYKYILFSMTNPNIYLTLVLIRHSARKIHFSTVMHKNRFLTNTPWWFWEGFWFVVNDFRENSRMSFKPLKPSLHWATKF